MSKSYVALLSASICLVVAGCSSNPHANMPSNAYPVGTQSIQSNLPSRDAGSEKAPDLAEVARINIELASSYYAYKQYDAALEAVGRAIDAQPSNPRALVLAGFVYQEMKDAARAQASFDKAASLSPNDPEILYNQATFLCRTGREEKSIAIFDKALSIPTYRRPGLAQAGAGVCLAKLNRRAEALERFNEALESEPMNPQALLGAAEINFTKGNVKRTQDLLKRYGTVAKPSAESLWLEVRTAKALNQADDARLAASDLRSQFPASDQTKMMDSDNR